MGSFRTCNDDTDGYQLRIDIINKFYRFDPPVFQSYLDACWCINIPYYLQNRTRWSINNYGHDLLACNQPNCSENRWKAEHVPPRLSCNESNCVNLNETNDSGTSKKYKVQSIGPDLNSEFFKTSCTHFIVSDEKKTAELESKPENYFKSLKTTLKNFKDEFKNFMFKFAENLGKLVK